MPVLNTAYKACIYGQEGVGKSTDAAKWPGPHFIDIDGSAERMDVERLPKTTPYEPPKSWAQVFSIINGLTKEPSAEHKKTLVFDTLDACMPLIVADVCAKNPKKDGSLCDNLTGFGWDAGYALVADEFSRLLVALDELRLKKQWHILLICHGTVRRLDLPEEDLSYERWEPALFRRPKNTPSPYDLVKSWVEMLLFYSFKTLIVEQDNGKAKAAGEQRVIRTAHSATWDAKNRNGLAEEIPLVKDKFALAHLFRDVTQKASAPRPATVSAKQPVPQAPPPTPAAAVQAPSATTPEPVTPPAVTGATLSALKQLMNSVWPEVTEKEIMAAVHKAGHFPADMPLANLPEEFIAGRLIANWDKVYKVVNTIRTEQIKAEEAAEGAAA